MSAQLLADAEIASQILKAIAHPVRLGALCLLGEKEHSVAELEEALGSSQSNISQHLAKLKSQGLVCSRKVANQVFYSVKEERYLKLIAALHEIFCQGS